MSHQIRHLSFGTYFPGMRNPLDNTSKHSADGAAEARYMIKVVPSAYEALNGSVTCSNLSLSLALPNLSLSLPLSLTPTLSLSQALSLTLSLSLCLSLSLSLSLLRQRDVLQPLQRDRTLPPPPLALGPAPAARRLPRVRGVGHEGARAGARLTV